MAIVSAGYSSEAPATHNVMPLAMSIKNIFDQIQHLGNTKVEDVLALGLDVCDRQRSIFEEFSSRADDTRQQMDQILYDYDSCDVAFNALISAINMIQNGSRAENAALTHKLSIYINCAKDLDPGYLKKTLEALKSLETKWQELAAMIGQHADRMAEIGKKAAAEAKKWKRLKWLAYAAAACVAAASVAVAVSAVAASGPLGAVEVAGLAATVCAALGGGGSAALALASVGSIAGGLATSALKIASVANDVSMTNEKLEETVQLALVGLKDAEKDLLQMQEKLVDVSHQFTEFKVALEKVTKDATPGTKDTPAIAREMCVILASYSHADLKNLVEKADQVVKTHEEFMKSCRALSEQCVEIKKQYNEKLAGLAVEMKHCARVMQIGGEQNKGGCTSM